MSVSSPFKCGGVAKSLPASKVGKHVVIRIDDLAPTAKVYFKVGESNVIITANNASGYLNGGEAIKIHGKGIKDASDIQLLDAANNPFIFFFIE